MLSRLMTRREQFVIAFLAVSIAVGAIVLYITQRESGEPAVRFYDSAPPAENPPATPPEKSSGEVPTSSSEHSESATSTAELVVSIQGAVHRPGVYTMAVGSRVHEIIDAAGGLLPEARTDSLNLAARLIDGTTLTVPSEKTATLADDPPSPTSAVNPAAYTIAGQESGSGTALPRAGTGRATGPIDINRATQSQLEQLPGVGPVLAQRIIQYRNAQPFRSVEQLTEVRGIGPKTLQDIAPMITVH